MRQHPLWLALAALIAQLCVSTPGLASGAQATSQWINAEKSRVRLVAGLGARPGADVPGLVAGVEIEMAKGWKTYWRNPGSSGVPPRMDWSRSSNLRHAQLLFPAPTRFSDPDGDTIGYKTAVAFPIVLTPADATKPVGLKISVEYGICEDICIPVELELAMTVDPGVGALSVDGLLAAFLRRVPSAASAHANRDPVLARATAELSGPKPRVVLEADFPGGAQGADLFVEAPDGIWVPLPRKAGEGDGDRVRFEIDLSDGIDVAALKGKTLRLTLVGGAGQSETTFRLD